MTECKTAWSWHSLIPLGRITSLLAFCYHCHAYRTGQRVGVTDRKSNPKCFVMAIPASGGKTSIQFRLLQSWVQKSKVLRQLGAATNAKVCICADANTEITEDPVCGIGNDSRWRACIGVSWSLSLVVACTGLCLTELADIQCACLLSFQGCSRNCLGGDAGTFLSCGGVFCWRVQGMGGGGNLSWGSRRIWPIVGQVQ